MRSKAVTRYADKSHQHVLNVSVVVRAFPDARFIHIVRDGRDAVASMLRHRGVLGWFSEDIIGGLSEWPQPWFGIEGRDQLDEWRRSSLATKCALRWSSWVETGLRAKAEVPKEHWLDIRYEDLASQPAATGTQVFRFLDLEADSPSLGDAHATSIGAWRDRLDRDELRDMIDVAGPLLERLGYAAEGTRADRAR